MSLLKHITAGTCKFCGAPAVQDEVDTLGVDSRRLHVHCNGQQFEGRRFACGMQVRWSPNYGREVWKSGDWCRDSLLSKERLAKQRAFKESVEASMKRAAQKHGVPSKVVAELTGTYEWGRLAKRPCNGWDEGGGRA